MKPLRTQKGITLVVALIMLVVLTLLALSAMTDSNSNLRVVGNMQVQAEATASAQQAIEQILSNDFTAAPTSAVISVDVNNDTVPDYTVNVAKPVCVSNTTLTNSTPNLPPQCVSSSAVSGGGGLTVTAGGASTAAAQAWCSAEIWELSATANSTGMFGGASTTVHQGTSLNVPIDTGC